MDDSANVVQVLEPIENLLDHPLYSTGSHAPIAVVAKLAHIVQAEPKDFGYEATVQAMRPCEIE